MLSVPEKINQHRNLNHFFRRVTLDIKNGIYRFKSQYLNVRSGVKVIKAMLVSGIIFISYQFISSSNQSIIKSSDQFISSSDFLKDFEQIPVLNIHPTTYIFDNGLIKDDEKDLWLEFGVYAGKSINMIASYSEAKNKIYGFDSFEGLPEKWERPDTDNYQKGHFGLKGKLPTVKANVQLVKGLFNDSIPAFVKEVIEPNDLKISYLHLDADLYSSTHQILTLLPKYIKKGAILDFDELLNYAGYENHEAKAFYEFVKENEVQFEWIGMANKIGSRSWVSEKAAARIISTKYTNSGAL